MNMQNQSCDTDTVRLHPLASAGIAVAVVASAVLSVMDLPGLSFLLLLLSCALFAYLLISTLSPWCLLTVPVVLAAVYLTAHPLSDIAYALMFLPIGLVAALCVLRGHSAAQTLLRMTGMVILMETLVYTFLFAEQYGTVSLSLIQNYLNDLVRAMTEFTSSVSVQMQDGTVRTLMDEQTAEAFAHSFIMLFPAIAVIMCSIIAYFVYKILCVISSHIRGGRVVPPENRVLSVSRIYAVLYAVTFAFSFFMTGDSVVEYVVENLSMILLPAMAVIGLRTLWEAVRAKRSGYVMLIVAFVFLLFMAPMYILYAAALAAIFVTLRRKPGDGSSRPGNEE